METEESDHLSSDERRRVRNLLERADALEVFTETEKDRLAHLLEDQREIHEIVESSRFARRIKSHIKRFAAWLVGFISFAVAVRDLFNLGKHG